MYALLATLILAGNPAAAPRATLTGAVQDEKGRPLAGATVFIRTAGPRQGMGVL